MQGSCAVCTLLRRTTETTVFLSTKRPKRHGCPAGKGWATPSSLQHYLTILFLQYGRLFGAVDAFITVIVQLPGRSIVAGERYFSVQIGFKASLRRAGGDEERQRPRLCGSLDFLLNQPFSGFRHFFTHVYAKHGPCIKCLAKRLLLEIELYYWYTSRARNRVGAIRIYTYGLALRSLSVRIHPSSHISPTSVPHFPPSLGEAKTTPKSTPFSLVVVISSALYGQPLLTMVLASSPFSGATRPLDALLSSTLEIAD